MYILFKVGPTALNKPPPAAPNKIEVLNSISSVYLSHLSENDSPNIFFNSGSLKALNSASFWIIYWVPSSNPSDTAFIP